MVSSNLRRIGLWRTIGRYPEHVNCDPNSLSTHGCGVKKTIPTSPRRRQPAQGSAGVTSLANSLIELFATSGDIFPNRCRVQRMPWPTSFCCSSIFRVTVSGLPTRAQLLEAQLLVVYFNYLSILQYITMAVMDPIKSQSIAAVGGDKGNIDLSKNVITDATVRP